MIAEKYDILQLVGSGSIGRVEHAVRKSDGLAVALKTSRCGDLGLQSIARKEYELLQRLSYHPKLLRAYDFFSSQDEQKSIMVMDYFDGQSLDKVVSASPGGVLLEETACVLARDLFEILGHLHGQGVLHRDVKPQNILVSRDACQFRLVDFNVAHCLEDGPSMTPTGTYLYAAPEVIAGDPHGEASDVWGAGLCIHLALCGKYPQHRRSNQPSSAVAALASESVACTGKRWEPVSAAAKAVVRSCLAVEECQRPSAEAVLLWEWLKE